jgi:hypothetical protein
MRHLIFAFLSFLTIAAAVPAAQAMTPLPPGSIAGGATSNVMQVHTGPRACHFVRGRWWRDTRPYSTPGCYGGYRRWHHHHRRHGYWHWHRR